MIGGGTAASVSAAAPLATTLPVELSAADRARVDAGPVHDGGLTTADQRQANSRACLRAASRLTAKRERWQADRARAAPGEAKRARRRVRRVVRRAA